MPLTEECWCKGAIPSCMLCGGHGRVAVDERHPDACGICDTVPAVDDDGVLVSHSPQCPRASRDVVAESAPAPAEATPEPMGLAQDVDVTAEPVARPLSGPERPQPVETDVPPAGTPGSFERGMAGSRHAAATWTDEQKEDVRLATRYAARMYAQFTTDEVWQRLWDVDPDFPVSKGIGATMGVYMEDQYGSGLTKSGREALFRSTGTTRKPQREDVNASQRLAVWESLAYDPGLCPRSLAGPVPDDVMEAARRGLPLGGEPLVRCSICGQRVPLILRRWVPFLSEHRTPEA